MIMTATCFGFPFKPSSGWNSRIFQYTIDASFLHNFLYHILITSPHPCVG